MNIQRNNLNYSRTPTEKKHLSSLQHPQVTQMQSYDSCPWPRPSETKGREGGYWGWGGGRITKRPFSRATVAKQNNQGPKETAKKTGATVIPRERGGGEVCTQSREKRVRRRGALRRKPSIPTHLSDAQKQQQTLGSVCT